MTITLYPIQAATSDESSLFLQKEEIALLDEIQMETSSALMLGQDCMSSEYDTTSIIIPPLHANFRYAHPILISDDVSFEGSLQAIKVALAERTPNCFISYGWEDNQTHPTHNLVKRLCTDLEKAGVIVHRDVNFNNNTGLITGERIEDFTRKIRKPDYFVITVCTPTFKRRATTEGTWLHHEVRLIKERLDEGDSFFYVPLLVEGDMDLSIPDDLEPVKRLYKDFRPIDSYNNNILEILREKLLKSDFLSLPASKENLEVSPITFSTTQRFNCNGGVFPHSLNVLQLKNFVDRMRENGKFYLQSIFDNLFVSSQNGFSTVCVTLCALDGMGGVGKTTLAVEYAWMFSHYYKEIFWINASSKSTCQRAYQLLFEKLSGSKSNDSLEELVPQVIGHLLQRSNWLIICDNVERYEDVYELGLLSLSRGYILCTSRHNNWVNNITVGLLDEEESIQLFYMRSGEAKKIEDSSIVKLLVNDCLNHLALAITQAGSYIRQNKLKGKNVSFTKYLEDFHSAQTRLKLLSHPVSAIECSIGSDSQKQRSIMTTWQITMDGLSEEVRDNAKLLMSYFSYLEPDMIPVELFYTDNKESVEKAIDELVSYSMINRNEDYVSIHRLIQISSLPNMLEQKISILTDLIYRFFIILDTIMIDPSKSISLKDNSKEDLYKIYDKLSLLLFHSEKTSSFLNEIKINRDRFIEETVHVLDVNFKILRAKMTNFLRKVILNLFDMEENKEDTVVLHNFIKKHLNINDNDFIILLNEQMKIFGNNKKTMELFRIFELLAPIESKLRKEAIDWFIPLIPSGIKTGLLIYALKYFLSAYILENKVLKHRIETELRDTEVPENWLRRFGELFYTNEFQLHARKLNKNTIYSKNWLKIRAEHIKSLKWKNAIIRSKCLFTEMMSLDEYIELIRTAEDMDNDTWYIAIERANYLIEKQTVAGDSVSSIESVLKLNDGPSHNTLSRSLSFIMDDVLNFSELIKILCSITDEQWDISIKRINFLVENQIDAGDPLCLIESTLSHEQLDNPVINRTSFLLINDVVSFAQLIKRVSRLSNQQWSAVFKKAKHLIIDKIIDGSKYNEKILTLLDELINEIDTYKPIIKTPIFTICDENRFAWLVEDIRRLVAAELNTRNDEVEVQIPLLDMGFDSLMSTAFTVTLSHRYRFKIMPILLFNYPTIHAIAHFIDQNLAQSDFLW